MSQQAEIVHKSEGNAWYSRNKDKPRINDRVLAMVSTHLNLTGGKRVLEIGCGDGWRLQRLREDYGALCWGCDLSWEAINAGREKHKFLNLRVAAADAIGYADGQFDMVILGFFLYQIDREDLAKVVAEVDRVLADKGTLVIHDFHVDTPYSKNNHHHPLLRTYKQDYSRIFSALGSYKKVAQEISGTTTDDHVGVTLMTKDLDGGWPHHE